jgi:hypothetical protein
MSGKAHEVDAKVNTLKIPVLNKLVIISLFAAEYKRPKPRDEDVKLKLNTKADKAVYYESIKRDLNTKPIYECRCDERLKTAAEESTRLAYTGLLGELEHLKRTHGGVYRTLQFSTGPSNFVQISRNCEASAVRGWGSGQEIFLFLLLFLVPTRNDDEIMT